MNIPEPVSIEDSDVIRDGGSYVLTYQSAGGDLIEITLKVVIGSRFERVGYQPPRIQSYKPGASEPTPSKKLSWEQGAALSEKLLPLLTPNIGLGGVERAKEMLRLLSLKGALE